MEVTTTGSGHVLWWLRLRLIDLIPHSLDLTTGALDNKFHITLAIPAGLFCTT
jgi:hypothetical protein